MSMDGRLAFDERRAKLIAFFFFPWQSKARVAVAPSSASIKQALRNYPGKAMESIPSQATVVNFARGKAEVD